MTWRTEFAADAERDFELIFDHLFDAYEGFGEARAGAFVRAGQRVERIRTAAEKIARAPLSRHAP